MSTAPPRPLSPIEQALALRQRGQLADAERILRNILVSEPGQRDAQHLLGLICHQQGRHVEALQLVGAVPHFPALDLVEGLANPSRATSPTPSFSVP